MMDVSGSMGDEQKEIVRIEAFWIDTWLKSQYKHIETRYIVHDAEAKEAEMALGWRASTYVRDAIAETGRWYREHGWLK